MDEELQKQAAEGAAKAQVKPAEEYSSKSALEERWESILMGKAASKKDTEDKQIAAQLAAATLSAEAQIESSNIAKMAQEYSAEKQLEGVKAQAEAQKHYSDNQVEISENQVEASKLTSEAQKYSAEKQAEGVKYQADAEVKVAETQASADIKVAEINKSAELTKAFIENLSEDAKTLDANEIKVLAILQKYGFTNFVDKESFINSLEGQKYEITGDFLALSRSDAKQLEKALKGDGKLLKADGKIDQETILAINAMALENIIPAAATLGVDALGNLVSQNGVNPEMLNNIKGLLSK